jgi:serine protease Do
MRWNLCAALRNACAPLTDTDMTQRVLALLLLLAAATASAAAVPATVAPDFVSLVKQEGAAVVNISTTRTIRDGELQQEVPGLSPDDPFYEFFRRFGPPGPREYQARSLGSGFIISEDGYILTNAHVIDEIDEATVKLLDKREFVAKVVGVDMRTDVALVKIDAKGLRKVTIGDAAKLEVGEWVAAIGSPFGFENSVTAGIVSAKGRLLPDESFVPFIQTDVAVNPGNSGGPLFNLRGEVVGINSMIFSGSGGYMGLSFATPIDVAMKVAGELRAHGRVIRGRLGVRIQDVTLDLAASFGLKSAQGALVSMVEKRSPADKAGFLVGDVILKVDGKAIAASGDLPQIIASTAPGTAVKFEVWRRGAVKELTATIEEFPSERPRAAAQPEERRLNRLGLALSEVTPAQREELDIPGGLLVRGASGPALKAGIQQGDVILAVNDVRLERIADFNRLITKLPAGSTVALLVLRGGSRVYVPLRLPS